MAPHPSSLAWKIPWTEGPGAQVSQEAGQVVWYSHLFQNFPQFIGIHTVKGFGPRGTPRVPALLPLSTFSPPDRDRRGDSPAWSGRGSRPSRRTSG